jgi:hypothetical protein
MAETLTELQAREEEVGREWKWLHDALNEIARARADQGDAAASGSCSNGRCGLGSGAWSCG